MNFIILHSKNKYRAVDRPMVRIFSDKNKTTVQNLLSIVNWENEMSDRNTIISIKNLKSIHFGHVLQ